MSVSSTCDLLAGIGEQDMDADVTTICIQCEDTGGTSELPHPISSSMRYPDSAPIEGDNIQGPVASTGGAGYNTILQQLQDEIRGKPFSNGLFVSVTCKLGHGIEHELPNIHDGGRQLVNIFNRHKYATLSLENPTLEEMKSLVNILSKLVKEPDPCPRGNDSPSCCYSYSRLHESNDGDSQSHDNDDPNLRDRLVIPRSYKRLVFHFNGHGNSHSLLTRDGGLGRNHLISQLMKPPLAKYIILDCCTNSQTTSRTVSKNCVLNNAVIVNAVPQEFTAYTNNEGFGIVTEAIVRLLENKRLKSIPFGQLLLSHLAGEVQSLVAVANRTRREEHLEEIHMTPVIKGALKGDVSVHAGKCEYVKAKWTAFRQSVKCPKCFLFTFISSICSLPFLLLLLAALLTLSLISPPKEERLLLTSSFMVHCQGTGYNTKIYSTWYESFTLSEVVLSGDNPDGLTVDVLSIPSSLINPRTIPISSFYPSSNITVVASTGTQDEQRTFLPLNYYNNPLYYLMGSVVTINFSISIEESDSRLVSSVMMYVFNNENHASNFVDQLSTPWQAVYYRRNFTQNATGHNIFTYRIPQNGYFYFVIGTVIYSRIVITNSFSADLKYLDSDDYSKLNIVNRTLTFSQPLRVPLDLSDNVTLCNVHPPDDTAIGHSIHYNVSHNRRLWVQMVCLFIAIFYFIVPLCFIISIFKSFHNFP